MDGGVVCIRVQSPLNMQSTHLAESYGFVVVVYRFMTK